MAVVAEPETVVFWELLEKPLGPDQVYEDIPLAPPIKFKASPSHTGELLEAVAVGNVFIVTDVEAVFVQPFPSVTVIVYVPAMAVVAEPETVGFCELLEKLLGPDQAYEDIPLVPPVRFNALP